MPRFVRFVNPKLWQGADRDGAAKDLQLRKGDLGLSLFEVSDLDHAQRVAVLRQVTMSSPDRVACIVFDGNQLLAADFNIQQTSHDTLIPELRPLHHEIRPYNNERSIDLARRLLKIKQELLVTAKMRVIERAKALFAEEAFTLEDLRRREKWERHLLAE